MARTIASWSMSIADRTACSASSEYGGWRSRKGSRLCDGAIEYSTDELDIFPSRAFPAWVAEQRGWVIGDDQRNAVKAVHLVAQLSDRQLRLQKSLSSERSKSKDCFWLNQLKLAQQVRAAGGYFVRHRIAIPWWPMLEHVADEHVFAREIHRREDLRQQLSCGADERQSLLVLRRAWCFADNHQVRVGVSRE